MSKFKEMITGGKEKKTAFFIAELSEREAEVRERLADGYLRWITTPETDPITKFLIVEEKIYRIATDLSLATCTFNWPPMEYYWRDFSDKKPDLETYGIELRSNMFTLLDWFDPKGDLPLEEACRILLMRVYTRLQDNQVPNLTKIEDYRNCVQERLARAKGYTGWNRSESHFPIELTRAPNIYDADYWGVSVETPFVKRDVSTRYHGRRLVALADGQPMGTYGFRVFVNNKFKQHYS